MKARFGLVAVLLLIAYGACRETPNEARAKRQSTLPDRVLKPQVAAEEINGPTRRIVAAAPNITEICCALGLAEQLVGRTRYCTYPPTIEGVRDIGSLVDANVETLHALRPDLILVAGTSRAMSERFAHAGLTVETLPDVTLGDLYTSVLRVGELAGRTKTARQLADGIRADLASVTERYRDVPPARVLLLIGTLAEPPTPPFVAGPGSFYDDLLRLAGHTNVAPEGGGAFAPLSLEVIANVDPDVIIELDADGTARPGGDEQALRVWRQLGDLRAVARRRVHVLTGAQHFVLGPRVAMTYEALCGAIGRADGE